MVLPNEEQIKTYKQVYGNRILDDEKEFQTNMMQVEESANAKEENQRSDQEADQCKTTIVEQNNVEEEVTEEDLESVQDTNQDKSPNEVQNNVEEKVQVKMTEVEESTKEIEEAKKQIKIFIKVNHQTKGKTMLKKRFKLK